MKPCHRIMERSTILIFLIILIAVIEVSSSISHDTTVSLKISTDPKKKIKRTKGSVQYYSNCSATEDIELNPGAGLRKCKMWKKLSDRIKNILLVNTVLK